LPPATQPSSWQRSGQHSFEDRNFHTIQCVEAAVRQHEFLDGTDDAALPLIAASRYLAAHATTTRSQRQTFEIARRLHRGERLYEDET
jgi:hypothetical protein